MLDPTSKTGTKGIQTIKKSPKGSFRTRNVEKKELENRVFFLFLYSRIPHSLAKSTFCSLYLFSPQKYPFFYNERFLSAPFRRDETVFL